jgi:hypothetical protein
MAVDPAALDPEIEEDDVVDPAEALEVEEDAEAEVGDETEPDDELEPEETEAEGDEPAASPARQPSRAARRITSLSKRLKELETELQATRARQVHVDPATAAEQQRLQAERDRAEDERVIMGGDAAEIARHFGQKAVKPLEQRLNLVQFQTYDANDKLAFQTLVVAKPHLGNVAEEVEKVLASERAQGRFPPRETIAYYLLGKRAADRAARAKGKQTRRADADRARQTVRSGRGAASDAAPAGRSRGDTPDARRKRLENLEI